MNLVFIMSDTLRRDHLGCYGNTWIRTPHLDRFAQQCVIFDRAYPSSFPTMPTRADLMTGKFTFTYLGWAPLPREEVVLAQVLAGAGYRTHAVVDTPFFVKNGYGYDRGFHDFVWIRGQGSDRPDCNYERRYEEDYIAPRTSLAAQRWLELHRKERFFLYVDMWDPHEPWDPPAHYVELYEPNWDGTIVRPPYWYWKERGLTAKDVRIAHACYCGEVSMVDRWVRQIISKLDVLGLLDKTVIIFVGDHGFYLGEHGMVGKTLMREGHFHGAPLYEEVTRVPLLIYHPDAKSRRVSAQVSLPDLMPTILDLLGVEVPDTVQGKSLAPVLRDDQRTHRSFAVTTMPLYNPGEVTRAVDNFERRVEEYLPATVTSGRWTLLYTREDAPIELYDLRSDPQQKKNVVRHNRDVAAKLHRQFFNLITSVGTEERLLTPRERL